MRLKAQLAMSLSDLSKKYGLGETLIVNLEDVKNDVLNKDYDAFFIVSGQEGNGKSTLTQRVLRYLSPTFNNDFIFFYREEWDKRKGKLQKGDAIDFTEGTEFAMSKEGMKIEVREFEKEITQWRGKNLFIFMEISDLKMLSRYLRESRPLGLFWIPRRGKVWVYSFIIRNSKDAARVTWIRKELMKGNFIYPSFISIFKKFDSRDKEWKLYQKRKKKFMKKEKESRRIRLLREKIEKKLKGSGTVRDIAKIYKISKRTAYKWINQYKYVPKKYLFKDFVGRVRITEKGLIVLDKKIKRKRGFN